jgi:hypothetical protein
MKGAITEPWLNTNKPPKIKKITSSGSSQNFFRATKNSKSSARIDMDLSF